LFRFVPVKIYKLFHPILNYNWEKNGLRGEYDMKKIMSICIGTMLKVSIYPLALADVCLENFEVSFELEAKNENGK
jgi:hypothetical protein